MSDNQWLDAPDGDGWWWFAQGDLAQMAYVSNQSASLLGGGGFRVGVIPGKWHRAVVPPPPQRPLPRSRTVELTAKVISGRDGCWEVLWYEGNWYVGAATYGSRDEAIALCRRHGIEPEVIES